MTIMNPKPIGIQVGLGVRNSAITAIYTRTLQETGNNFDLLRGKGFLYEELVMK